MRSRLWWPPTKIAGRYLSSFLAGIDPGAGQAAGSAPAGQPVELDLGSWPSPGSAATEIRVATRGLARKDGTGLRRGAGRSGPRGVELSASFDDPRPGQRLRRRTALDGAGPCIEDRAVAWTHERPAVVLHRAACVRADRAQRCQPSVGVAHQDVRGARGGVVVRGRLPRLDGARRPEADLAAAARGGGRAVRTVRC